MFHRNGKNPGTYIKTFCKVLRWAVTITNRHVCTRLPYAVTSYLMMSFWSGADSGRIFRSDVKRLHCCHDIDRPCVMYPLITGMMCCSQGDGLTYPVRTVDEDYDSLLGQRQRWSEEGENEDGTAGGWRTWYLYLFNPYSYFTDVSLSIGVARVFLNGSFGCVLKAANFVYVLKHKFLKQW